MEMLKSHHIHGANRSIHFTQRSLIYIKKLVAFRAFRARARRNDYIIKIQLGFY